MSNQDINLAARAWAESVGNIEGLMPGPRAAAEVIQSLPDTIVDGDKLREVISEVMASTRYGTVGRQVAEEYAALIGELIPNPSPPTLADMNPEERKACQWMQARLGDESENIVIVSLNPAEAWIMWDDGGFDLKAHDEVTPLPDLPKLEWPSRESQPEYRPNLGPITLTPPTREEEAEVRKQLEEPTLADLISPEEVPPGEPWSVRYYGKEWSGIRADDDIEPWSIISMDGLDYRDVEDSDITLMFRLVPETP